MGERDVSPLGRAAMKFFPGSPFSAVCVGSGRPLTDKLPEIGRLSGDGFAWRERDLSLPSGFANELTELDGRRERGSHGNFFSEARMARR